MKSFYFRIFTFLFFAGSVFFAQAQRSSGLMIDGTVMVEEGSPDNVIIEMYEDGKKAPDYGIGNSGKFKVELNYNHKFELIFKREGNFPQKIVIETTVPKAVLDTDPRFPPFPVNINLFKEIPGVDASFSENTVLKIYYSNSVDNFIQELYYNDAQIAKLIEQAVLTGQQIDRRAEYMAKLTRAELAELRKEYNELLEQAGKEYANEQFVDALDGYKAATKIFPDEQFPKDRIAEINDLLGLIMVAGELDKAMLERFNKLVKDGDLLFNQKNYAEAKKNYDRALSIKPTDEYVISQLDKIAQIQKLLHQEEEYNNLIASGDKALKELLYNEALGQFQQALKIKPNEAYPKNKINEINGLLANQQKESEKQQNYEEAMKEGDRQFSKQFYDRALTQFENALTFKPGDATATKRVAETKEIMQGILDKMAFDKFIAEADKAYKKQEFAVALSNYEEALALVPDEPRTKKRVEEIRQIIHTQQSLDGYISQADKQFDQQKYTDAKTLYERARELDSKNKHVSDRLNEIAQLLSGQELEVRYAETVASADELLKYLDYENARNKYNEALSIKPRENYPKEKIAEIGNILAAIAKTNTDYQNAVARADRLFQQKNYQDAKTAFADAGRIKPEQSYPPQMISQIDGLIADQQRVAQEAAEAEAARLAALQAEKDKNYADAIARADNLFNEKNYENSRNEYRSALTIKPEESYPQQRIDEIGNLFAQLSAAQKAYEEAVAKGDREFRGESWDAAIAAYNDAKKAKADEAYPDEQLAKIDSIVTTRERLAREAAEAEAARLAALQAEKDKNYADAIARADNLFNEKNYENSRNEYRSALTIKPEETYPQQRIDEIGNLLAQLSAAQKAYEEAVAKGDREFRGESWDAAIVAYNDAKKAKADETYPDEQLAKIDSIVTTRERLAREAAEAEAARLAAIQAEKDKNYADAIARADNLFNEKNYENSRNEYRSALAIKPEETYPQQQISEIDRLLKELADAKAAQEALDRQYAGLIQQADRMFSAKSYNPSKENYQKASDLKPDESYPKEKIVEIDNILTRQAIDEKYRNVIVAADGLFRTQKYDDARLQYEIALGVKPEEEYPKSQIRRIDEIKAQEEARKNAEASAAVDVERRRANIAKMQEELDEQKILEESGLNALYDQLILKADAFFDDTQYNVSRAWYYKALDLKPEEAYPQQRIDEINRILNGRMLSQRDREYQRFIDLADNSFRDNELAVARGWYNQAIGQKPDEKYPKEQLAEIGRLVQERLQGRSADRVEQYKATAKKELDAGNTIVARFWYKKALELNPDDAEAKAGLAQTR